MRICNRFFFLLTSLFTWYDFKQLITPIYFDKGFRGLSVSRDLFKFVNMLSQFSLQLSAKNYQTLKLAI